MPIRLSRHPISCDMPKQLPLENRHAVERGPNSEGVHISDNRDGSSELLVNHKSKDAQHSGAAVVKLDSSLEEFLLLVERVPSEVDPSVAEVTDELVSSSLNVLHEEKLHQSNQGEDLGESLSGDGVGTENGGKTVRVVFAQVSGKVDLVVPVETGTGEDVSKEGKHGNTSVLDLDVSESVESLLVGIIKKAEGIIEADRGLDTKLTLESVEGGGLGSLLSRGKGGGGGQAGGEYGSGLHGSIVWCGDES